MPMQAPPVDERTHDEIVSRVQELAQTYTNWQPPSDGEPDGGEALIHIFGRLAELVIERLNQAPEKNFLAFLDLIGTQILPPQPARVPLTFQLAAGSPVDARVPARTQAAAPPAEGEETEVIYETDRELVVTTAQLTAVFVREPGADRYGDYTLAATGVTEGTFPAFIGDTAIEHSLYLARDDFFTLPAPKSARFTIESPDAVRLAVLPMAWSYWDGEDWQPLSVTSAAMDGSWQVSIADLPAPAPKTIDGLEAGWIKAQLAVPLPPDEGTDAGQPPGQIRRQNLAPDAAVAGQTLLDLAAPFYPFTPTEPLASFFYLNVEEAFVRAGAAVTLDVRLAQTGRASTDLVFNWSFWDGSSWQTLGASTPDDPSAGVDTFAFADETQTFTQDGTVRFTVPISWRTRALFGTSGHWLRVQIVSGDYGTGADLHPPWVRTLTAAYTWELPRMDHIEASMRVVRSDLAPDLGFANILPLDLSKDFYPFGEKPRLGDTLYLASLEVFAKAGAVVTLDVTLSNPNPDQEEPDPKNPPDPPVPVLASPDLEVVWEVWDGQTWLELGRSTPKSPAPPESSEGFSDGTQAFTDSGSVELVLPEMGQGTVNGETHYWLRARIAHGNYGREAYYAPITDPETGQRTYELVPATFAPPLIQLLRLGYTYEPNGPPDACWAYNEFTFVDHTAAARSSGSPFLPFTPTTDTRSTLYLGFDRPFANRTVTLYTGVKLPLYDTAGAADRGASAADPARVSWTYAGPDAWLSLGARDETDTFTARGLITFIGPRDLTARTQFGLARYWLRARWEKGVFAVPPRLRRVLTNTTWASQATTIQNETLGSSSGEPDQVLRTSKTPVLLDPKIEVREPELPAAAEREVIEAEEGEDAITTVLNAGGRPVAIWVRWHQVPDFHGSGPRDRHYVLDHLTGDVYFGDGQHGMIPPQGRNTLRAALYRTGGGTRGNRPAGTIVQLKSAVPYVDGVTNHEPAAGGAEQETLENVKERGPKALRHRNRAVTTQDFEDLAYEASSNVARVRAIVPHYDSIRSQWTPPYNAGDAGRVGLIIVPHSPDIPPTPSLELIDRIEEYILTRAAPTLDLWIAGPDWVRVTVDAQIAPVSFEAADTLVETVATAVQRFLHPLTGGSTGNGWAFGRKPHRSDLYALLESIEGVDHVRALQVTEEEMGAVRPDRFLVFSGMHTISLVSPQEGA